MLCLYWFINLIHIIMITIQNKELVVVAANITLTKALVNAGIPLIKYSYIRQKLSASKHKRSITWKGFIIRRWKK